MGGGRPSGDPTSRLKPESGAGRGSLEIGGMSTARRKTDNVVSGASRLEGDWFVSWLIRGVER